MVLSAPINLRPQVRIPSEPSTLSSIYILEIEIETVIVIAMRKGRKEAEINPFLQNSFKAVYAFYLKPRLDLESMK